MQAQPPDTRNEEGERRLTDQALRYVALGVSAATGSDVFPAIVQYLALTLQVDFAFLGKLEAPGRIRTLAVWQDGALVDNVGYELDGTPCREVIGNRFRFIPEDVRKRYPGDNMLAHFGFEAYAGYPLFDSRGEALGIIAVTHRKPLTDAVFAEAVLKVFSVRAAAELERLRADEALRASEASYRAIFEASEDAIFVHDIDTGAIVDVNPKACEVYGYTHDEMLRVNVGDLSSGVPPYTLEHAAEIIGRARAGTPQRVEWHRRNRDGSLHWDEVCLRRATIGGVDRIVAFTREITERKEREEALRKSEDRLRSTIEAALDCIIGMDGSGRIIEFNPAAERCFGRPRETVIGRPLADMLMPERYRTAHWEGLLRHRETGQGHFLGKRVEVTALRANGEEFPAELTITEAQGPEGPIFIGYLRDITERKRADEQRLLLESQLRQAQKMEAIGHLAGGIAHDFNNILTGIMGYLLLAQERSAAQKDEKLAQYLERAQHSGQRARDLIRQLLTFSRGQRGEPRPLALTPIVSETARLLRSILPASVELETRLEKVPTVHLDPVHLEQVLMNLCINARDAMEGSGRIELTLETVEPTASICASCRRRLEGRFIQIGVRDNGPGIAPEHLDRIFEPFFTTKEVGHGSGMGLSTVHGILHEYDAHILLDTAPGQGAWFRLLLQPLDASPVDEPEPAQHGSNRRRLQGHALVVDDDEAVGDFVTELLESWGLTTTLARHATEAQKRFRAAPRRFDFALLDQTMPGMTGTELADWLLKENPDLPILLYTGYGDQLSEERVRAAGMRALLAKPLDPDALYRHVETLLAADGRHR